MSMMGSTKFSKPRLFGESGESDNVKRPCDLQVLGANDPTHTVVIPVTRTASNLTPPVERSGKEDSRFLWGGSIFHQLRF